LLPLGDESLFTAYGMETTGDNKKSLGGLTAVPVNTPADPEWSQ
jgi:hypothetical protein